MLLLIHGFGPKVGGLLPSWPEVLGTFPDRIVNRPVPSMYTISSVISSRCVYYVGSIIGQLKLNVLGTTAREPSDN